MTQKWKFCQLLLTLMLFQTCMTLVFLWNTKKNILKNAGNQTVSFPIEFHYIFKPYSWNQWEQKLLVIQLSNFNVVFVWTYIRRYSLIALHTNSPAIKPGNIRVKWIKNKIKKCTRHGNVLFVSKLWYMTIIYDNNIWILLLYESVLIWIELNQSESLMYLWCHRDLYHY